MRTTGKIKSKTDQVVDSLVRITMRYLSRFPAEERKWRLLNFTRKVGAAIKEPRV